MLYQVTLTLAETPNINGDIITEFENQRKMSLQRQLVHLFLLIVVLFVFIIPIHWYQTPKETFLQEWTNGKIGLKYKEPQTKIVEKETGLIPIELSKSQKFVESSKKHGYRAPIKTPRMRMQQLPNPPPMTVIRTLNDPDASIHTVVFSPDGKMLASGSFGNTIQLWDVSSGVKISTLTKGFPYLTYGFFSIVFSPDGTMVVSGGGDIFGFGGEGDITFWNVSSGDVLYTIAGDLSGVSALDFSPNGTILASGSGGDGLLSNGEGNITLWNAYSGTKLLTMEGVSHGVTSVDFSPDGTLLASGGLENTVKLWDVKNGVELYSMTGHTDRVTSVVFSPDGAVLISGSYDGTIKLWSVASGEEIQTLTGHNEWVESVAFSPDGKMFVSASFDNSIKLWNVSNGVELISLTEHTESVNSVAYSPDGSIVASGSSDTTIKLWNVARETKIDVLTLRNHTDPVRSVAFSKDGSVLASASWDKTIRIWNVSNGEEMQTLTGHTDWVSSVAFSHDGLLMASGSYDNTSKLWNATSWDELHTLTGHSSGVESISFSPWSTILASGSSDGTIRLWNTTNGAELFTLNHSGVSSVAFSPDGKILASSGFESVIEYGRSTIKLWNVTSREELYVFTGDNHGFISIAFSPSGTILASGKDGGTIKLWNLTSMMEINTIITDPSEFYSVISVAFSPNGALLASGAGESFIKLWNVSDWKEIQSLSGHNFPVSSVVFSPDGEDLASSSFDNTIKLWKVNSISTDFDLDFDGLPDRWENQYGLDPTSFWDKFNDPDNDGLMNSLEFFLKTNPIYIDSDNDWMPDGWEYLGGLDPTINDASSDKDTDGLPALYEFRMGLNPRVNDSGDDPDNDGLTNLQEFNFGSSPNLNDTEGDGMPDLYEYQMGLNPRRNDIEDDKDNDGMPNLWEYKHSYNANDSTDAMKDSDGDWILNVEEFRGGSDPHDFWSVPLISFSVIHFGSAIIIIVSTMSVYILMNYWKKQKSALVKRLKAPDYTTALKIRKTGFSDYFAFVKAETETKSLIQMGNDSYSKGEFLTAIQHYEHALKTAERLMDNLLIAEIIFRLARIHKEKQILTHESSILLNFPQPPFELKMIEAYDHMIKALLAETEKNWGLADKAWKAALSTEGLEIEFHTICQGAVVKSEVNNWLNNPTSTTQEEILTRLEGWQNACEINQQLENLCEAYLLRARIALVSFQFGEVEKWLDLCQKTAEESGYISFINNAVREKAIFLEHKQRISSFLEMETTLNPVEQEKKLKEYIKAALLSLET